ncbi:MAG TPA: N-acetyl-gamma-glutamyl-phosphate reductase [Coriobacteriia bacterium]|nr:N-acetyl-gamma-glutamyl-phosphate reductase [Coriobacteriia bacterium]
MTRGPVVVRAAIVGASGYAGVELTRLLAAHPVMRPVVLTSASEAGRRVGDVYPALAPHVDATYVAPDIPALANMCDVAFLAMPHTAALGIAPELRAAGVTVIDVSADFRLSDAEVYERWYGVAHSATGLLAEAVYGLPEMDRSALPGSGLVACAGCYPTATLLAALPALEAGVTASDLVIVDAKSGVSGAGRSPGPGTHFPAVGESLTPYNVTIHRHTPEMAQGLSRIAGSPVRVVFSPHLVPMSRGLLATVYLRLTAPLSAADAVTLYRERYAGEPFVTVHDAGRMPSTLEVRGSNRAHLGVAVDEEAGMLVAACAIDNLVKGAAGQAVQCANLALGIEETAGLDLPVPVV